MQRNNIQKSMMALGSLLLTACLQKPISEPLQDQPSAEKQQKPDSETLLVRVVNGKRFEIPKGYFDSDEPEPYLENFGNDPNNKVSSRIEPLKFELPSWQPQMPNKGGDCIERHVDQKLNPKSQLILIDTCEQQKMLMSWEFNDPSSYVFVGPEISDSYYKEVFVIPVLGSRIQSTSIYGLLSFPATSTQSDFAPDAYIQPSREKPTTIITCTPKSQADFQSSNFQFGRDLIATCEHRFLVEDLQVRIRLQYHRNHLPQWQDMEAKMRTWIKQHQVQSS